MSLRVWMPLIKQQLTQQGLSSGVLSGSPIWGYGGKISERCFRCDGPITTTINDLVNVTTFSIAYWLYIDSSKTDFTNYADFFQLQAISGNTTTVIRDELRTNTANLGRHNFHMIKDANVGSNTYTYYGLGERDDAKDKWCHIVVTKDINYCDIYADGVRYNHVACSNFESSPCKLTGVMQLGMTGCTSGYLQDFRVYDHCLSESEIKRLAQGLIVHYPLNNNGLGNENLYGYGSDCTNLSRLNQSTNKFTVVTEDGHVCAHASGALQTTAYLQSQIPFTPKPLEYITFSAYVKIKNIVRGTTNPMCEFYFSGQTIDGTWRSVKYIKWTKDGVEVSHTAIGFDNTGSFNMNDGKWHYVTATIQFLNYNYTSDCRPSIYLRDCTGDMYVHHIKYERGQVATPWRESSYANLAFANPNDYTTYVEPDGSRWLRIFHHNNPISTLFASTDDFANGFYKDTNRWYRIENICGMVSQWEFMVKQKPTSDGTESKYRWIQTKNPIVATHNDVSPSAVTRITTSGYTDGTYGGLYKSATGRTRLTIANGVADNWWGALGCWTDYSGGIPGYPQIKVTTGYIDLYIRIDNLSLGGTEYDISGNCYNATRKSTFTCSSDTPKYVTSTLCDGTTVADVPTIYGSTDKHKQLTIATWIKRASDDANYHYFWKSPAIDVGLRPYNGVNNYYVVRWTHSTADTVVGDHTWVTNVIPLNTWVHSVWVFDSGIWKHYVNGIQEGGTRNDSSTGLYISGDIGGALNLGKDWIGQLSDFRIYATALSADDIKSLYQNCATIGPDGTTYGQIRN